MFYSCSNKPSTFCIAYKFACSVLRSSGGKHRVRLQRWLLYEINLPGTSAPFQFEGCSALDSLSLSVWYFFRISKEVGWKGKRKQCPYFPVHISPKMFCCMRAANGASPTTQCAQSFGTWEPALHTDATNQCYLLKLLAHKATSDLRKTKKHNYS